ncbi:acyl-CoA dehydrogenase family protein [Pseudonocardia oroxyli]|uniref:Acyl-CoA dehydrogenase n=1 Tax=Pseudonocardia oroxyli TaxID=366584 RepID=A0A1G8DY11_PSEOR|nr:acyl-CoA dehydrogenase family protein [Pseudonocardia oroxyli]SDH62458.1 Acyl-CoA dehydrogenase [Pseudonocardia oroxyli]
MDFSLVELTRDQQIFQRTVRALLDEVVTDEVHEHERATGDGISVPVHLALGRHGWVMPEWPVEDGGAGLDPVCRRILELELARYQVPRIGLGTTRLVWAAVERFGSRELRERLGPGVADGSVRFCLGYSEPDGGSDIAAARVRAVRDGDHWIVNGSKLWTTGAQCCQYSFVITRTDPDLPKHKGLTMFLVPLDLPGVEIQPIMTYGGERTNAVFFGDVRVSDDQRLGEVNDGWTVLRGPLDKEHSLGPGRDVLEDLSSLRQYLRPLETALDVAVAWARDSTKPDGSGPLADAAVLERLGRAATEIELAVCTPGPLGRVKIGDVMIEQSAQLMDLVGTEALISAGADGALGHEGDIDFTHRFAQGTTIYGGTVEVFRNIIAQHDLHLPRASFPGAKVVI